MFQLLEIKNGVFTEPMFANTKNEVIDEMMRRWCEASSISFTEFKESEILYYDDCGILAIEIENGEAFCDEDGSEQWKVFEIPAPGMFQVVEITEDEDEDLEFSAPAFFATKEEATIEMARRWTESSGISFEDPKNVEAIYYDDGDETAISGEYGEAFSNNGSVKQWKVLEIPATLPTTTKKEVVA